MAATHYPQDCHVARDPHAEPLADDLATLLLDLLVSEAGFERHGVNLLLLFGDGDAQAGATDETARRIRVHGPRPRRPTRRTTTEPARADRLLRSAACAALLDAHGHTLVANEARGRCWPPCAPRPGPGTGQIGADALAALAAGAPAAAPAAGDARCV